jgi:hypothetical protein
MSVSIETAFGPLATSRFGDALRPHLVSDSHPQPLSPPHFADATWNPVGTTVRIASARDMQQVRRLRYRVMVEEQGRLLQSVDWRRRELSDALDDCSTVWYARDGRAMVGTISQTTMGPDFDLTRLPSALELAAFPRSAAYPLAYSGRFVIASTHRSTWVLPSLARHVYAHGRRLGAKFDFMATTPALVPLFERLGYLRYTASAHHLPGDNGLLIPMVLPATDYAHLRRVRSPCLAAAAHFHDEPEWGAWLRASHPLIEMYYGESHRLDEQAAALAEWLRIPVDAAAELNAMSFVHYFPAGTPLRLQGDRVTSTLLAVNAPLICEESDRGDERYEYRDRRCGAASSDGVARSTRTIRCDGDTIVLFVPDAALVRMARRYRAAAEHLDRLFRHARIDERKAMRVFR